jgi:hypothetical protein
VCIQHGLSRFKERPEYFPKEMLIELAELLSSAAPYRSAMARTERSIVDFKIEEDEE